VSKTIIVTGARGFVGSAVAGALEAADFDVVRVTRNEWDMREPLSAPRFPSRADAIVHAAAITDSSARDLERVNVAASGELASFAATHRTGHVVFVSTGGVYGMGTRAWLESDPLRPYDAYSESKAQAEQVFLDRSGDYSVTITRLFFPYGFGQRGRLIPNLIDRIAADQTIELHNATGSPTINPIFIDDVAASFVDIVRAAIGGIINLAGPDSLTIREIATVIADQMRMVARFSHGSEPDFTLLGDTSRLRGLFQHASLTSFRCGLAATMASCGTLKA
jgi:UDP-glucose 4-epimerase